VNVILSVMNCSPPEGMANLEFGAFLGGGVLGPKILIRHTIWLVYVSHISCVYPLNMLSMLKCTGTKSSIFPSLAAKPPGASTDAKRLTQDADVKMEIT